MRVHFAAAWWVACFALASGASAAVTGNPEAGKAQAAACGACHGQDGATPLDPTYPVLAGQNERYLKHQLEMIQTDARQIPLMAGQLNGKTEQDLADLAAYYASLPSKVGQAQGDDDTLARAERLYRGGDLQKGVAACIACHGPSGRGNAPAGFPMVSGQAVGYTKKQLTEYREGRRNSDESYGGMMRGVAARLTDTEIAALAEYLHGLH
ncbi:MAG: c-type cytochrome [Pseudomonadales bacterium]|jgi:cytochrome c553